MADATKTIPDPADALKGWLLGGDANVGEARVVGVDVGWDEDAAGEPILRFAVSLADPSDETWPLSDVQEFHRRLDEHAAQLGLDAPYYVGLEAETQEEFDLS